MSDAVQLALIACIPPTIAALGALIVSLRNGVKTTTLVQKTDEIHVLANSTLTSVRAQLATATARIEDLQRTVSDLVEKKTIVNGTLAQGPP